jgi:stage II sporulation protein D
MSLRFILPTAWLLVPVAGLALLLWPGGCASTQRDDSLTRAGTVIRIKLLSNQTQLPITAWQNPTCYTSLDPARKSLNLRPDSTYTIALTAGGWKIGDSHLGEGTLVLCPSEPRAMAVNGKRYRGVYQLVPTGGGRFDVVNHVEIDDYLKGVLRAELFAHWHENTYKAQAIAARTYALYEHADAVTKGRHWDVHDDQQSQMYGGVDAETSKAVAAVRDTAGVVLVWGAEGRQAIFKAFYSSSCGGVSQSVTHAGFDEPYIPPLGAHDNQGLCKASPKFNWGPIVVKKEELTRRVQLWGKRLDRAEQAIGLITRVEVQQTCLGRPVWFKISTVGDKSYGLSGEHLRQAVNAGAPDGSRLFSSFVSVITDSDSIRFVDGHGFGHGVGMCQWCAEARARAGLSAEDIVLAGYPGAKLAVAY